ncbi:HD domain-containing protein [Streptomyces sp. NPDC005091]
MQGKRPRRSPCSPRLAPFRLTGLVSLASCSRPLSQGVAARTAELARIVGRDSDLLAAAAMLHDVGFAPRLAATGFHPLDGATSRGRSPGPRHCGCYAQEGHGRRHDHECNWSRRA